MIESLTGYGCSERDLFRVEVKSLNHRFLEINIKVPTVLMKHEFEIRDLVKSKFQRGKIELTVSINQRGKTGKIYLNKPLALQLYSAFIDLKKELSILGSIDISMFSNFRELFIHEEEEPDREALLLAVQEALDRLHEMRLREGEIIKKYLLEIYAQLERDFQELERIVDLGYNNYIVRLKERVKDLISNNHLDEKRVYEQLIIFAQKVDIKEEVDRLKSHMIQFRETLSNGNSIGKKLDFILQEMNREINTILAKTEDFQIKSISIEVKTQIERLKEQVQNIQ